VPQHVGGHQTAHAAAVERQHAQPAAGDGGGAQREADLLVLACGPMRSRLSSGRVEGDKKRYAMTQQTHTAIPPCVQTY
jgi:hypothetical protein